MTIVAGGHDVKDVYIRGGGPVSVGGLSIPDADYISLGYTGANLTTVVYKSGGASGTVVATLTLTYDGSGNILTVTRT